MKHWRLVTPIFLVLAIPFACDLERRAKFPDNAERLVPPSGTVVPAQAVTSKAPPAVSAETEDRKLAHVQQAKTPEKSEGRFGAVTIISYGGDDEVAAVDGGDLAYEAGAAATRGVGPAIDNPYGADDEGAAVDGGDLAYEAGAAATRGADAELPDRADGAASPKPTGDGATTPVRERDATRGAGEASAGDDDAGTDDGRWL